ncbi:HAD-IA family hydrolase [Roseobacter sp. OBYS 0001]|uniref:HAD-IA family hydrolase n=1 Tax=Roseobacter sp. OBYS 0001 TaxID=882651 RepID=UPI001BBEA52A|nr:HAD-IA family hydrolase [Roseobacter sp. OBYS 0001]GIT89194.1 haloacid dehalogenase [Roseobacter sp. OBYS 0001]
MSTPLRLVIFDVDGTLVDSQGDILGAMRHAFGAVDLEVPSRDAVLGIVGLSLPVAMARLAPDAGPAVQDELVEGYKSAYVDMRAKVGAAQSSPLYPGARDSLEQLHAAPEVLLGVATGKSKRGLDSLIKAHDLGSFFVTQQVADFHPSKPHPSMILQAMADTGVDPENTVMIGDTSFDMEMAQSAGVRSIGVSWGYHPVSALTGAAEILTDFAALPTAISRLWER